MGCKHRLYLYNDDVHSYLDVVGVIQEVMLFNKFQAEQCTMIIHHNRKIELTSGSKKRMTFFKNVFTELGYKSNVVYE